MFALDLGLAYACALALFYWLLAWLLPIAGRALVAAVRRCWTRVRMRFDGGAPARSLPRHLPPVRVRALF